MYFRLTAADRDISYFKGEENKLQKCLKREQEQYVLGFTSLKEIKLSSQTRMAQTIIFVRYKMTCMYSFVLTVQESICILKLKINLFISQPSCDV